MADIFKKQNFAARSRNHPRLLRAFIRAALVIFMVMLAVFFSVRLIPGDPAVMVLGEHADETAVQALREKLGLNQPAAAQFFTFIKNIFTRLDTGDSIKYGVSCRELILRHAPVTLLLCFMSLIITALTSVLLAVMAARHEDGLLDHIIRIVPAFTFGMPVFWTGLMLILLFSVHLGWFPVGGSGNGSITSMLHALILPAVTVSLGQVPPLVRSLRERLLEVMDADFVLTLKASGLRERDIFIKHIIKNAFAPALMLLGTNFSYLAGGTIVIEKVFGIRGMGRLLFDAISNRDLPLVQAIALYMAVFVVLISMVTEAAAAKGNPYAR